MAANVQGLNEITVSMARPLRRVAEVIAQAYLGVRSKIRLQWRLSSPGRSMAYRPEDPMIRKGEVVLDDLDKWRHHAGPKSREQWVDHRSAKESARTWLEEDPPAIPAELVHVLTSSPDFGELHRWEAEPEALVAFDQFGGPANLDVLLTGVDEYGPMVMAVEAKADEPFGQLVHDALGNALERGLAQAHSNGVARIEQLAQAILGPRAKEQPDIRRIRYQLLTATAAAIAAGIRAEADRAVLMIHEFRTPRTEADKLERNQHDLHAFLERLGAESPERVASGGLCGPLVLPGAPLFDHMPRFYVGKALREVAGGAPTTPTTI